ncbi:MAG: GIY-YIG nuclease family protein [Chroococcidiopsis sp.]
MQSTKIKTPSDNWGLANKPDVIMHQIATVSNKDSNKFPKPINIIGDRIGYALLDSLSCIVRDLRSRKASTTSVRDISELSAIRSKLLRLGEALPLSHSHQFFTSTPVLSFSFAYESVKNSCLVIGFLTNESDIIRKYAIGLFTNIAQITKHLSPQVLVTNLITRKDGLFFRKTYEQYTKPKGRLPSPSFVMPSYADMEGGVVERDCLTSIPLGREGWIYLIHAEGTNRYKIGRSINPIARASEIQKQSPYPLKIVESTWTLDAPSDEAKLHRLFADYRIFGEWFDFGSEIRNPNKLGGLIYLFFNCTPTMEKLGESAIESITNFLGVADPDAIEYCHIIWGFYSLAQSRPTIILVEQFVRKTLPQLILGRGDYKRDVINGCLTSSLQEFIAGALLTFEEIVFNAKSCGGQND